MNRPAHRKARPITAEVAHSLAAGEERHHKLSGLDLARIRIAASRSTLPTKKRALMYWRTKGKGAHVGAKQKARMAARAANGGAQ